MRKQIKLAVLAAATGLVAASAQAQATYNNDLIVGFTSGSGSDFIYDLGAESSLTIGEVWHLGTPLSGFNLSTVNWGVIGDNYGTKTVWSTTDGNSTPRAFTSNSDLNNNIDSPTASIYANLGTAGAGNSASPDSSVSSSWYAETLQQPGSGNAYDNSYNNPNIAGENSDVFYSLQGAHNGATVAGYFNLAANGDLTFVPEPSTIGLLTAAGLLTLALRNKFRRNQLT